MQVRAAFSGPWVGRSWSHCDGCWFALGAESSGLKSVGASSRPGVSCGSRVGRVVVFEDALDVNRVVRSIEATAAGSILRDRDQPVFAQHPHRPGGGVTSHTKLLSQLAHAQRHDQGPGPKCVQLAARAAPARTTPPGPARGASKPNETSRAGTDRRSFRQRSARCRLRSRCRVRRSRAWTRSRASVPRPDGRAAGAGALHAPTSS